MRFRLTTIGVIIALSALACFAQDATGARVDEFIKSEQRIQRIPGISLAVIKNGEIVLARGYGLANVEHQVAVNYLSIRIGWQAVHCHGDNDAG